jgi:tRNA A58 N-methylase Trm61
MSQTSFFVSIDELIGGYVHAQVVYVAAKLGLADLMCDRSRTVEDVAALVEVNPDALRRMMVSLAHLGIFEQKENDTYQLAAGHEVLRSDHPHSIRSYVIVSGEVYYRAFAELFHSVKTGKTGSEAAFGKSFFAYLNEHPDVFEHFNTHMSRRMRWDIEAAMGAYDFSPYKRVVDVGGGNGRLLSLLLQKYPQMQAILFDLPIAQTQAKESLEQAGVAKRCDLVSGDFFLDELPKGGDLYLLSLILHDWDDEQALRILQNCRQAMSSESKLVLIEFLLQEQQEAPRVAKEDLFMLVVTGGRERTSEQFCNLLSQAGFQLIRTVSTPGRRNVIEAAPC